MTKPHGTKGELFVWPLTDHPERALAPGVIVHWAGEDERSPDPVLGESRIERARPFRRGLLVSFAGVEDRDAAEGLRGRYLLRPLSELELPREDEVFYHELLESTVVTKGGDEVGRVREVYELRPYDLLEVRSDDGRIRFIPFAKEIVVRVDRPGREVVIDPPEGLLEL